MFGLNPTVLAEVAIAAEGIKLATEPQPTTAPSQQPANTLGDVVAVGATLGLIGAATQVDGPPTASQPLPNAAGGPTGPVLG